MAQKSFTQSVRRIKNVANIVVKMATISLTRKKEVTLLFLKLSIYTEYPFVNFVSLLLTSLFDKCLYQMTKNSDEF
jgi:hypothetical protein